MGKKEPTKKEKARAWASSVRSQIGFVGGKVMEQMAGGSNGVSREFYLLLKAIGEATSKQEEERIIAHEAETLKKHLSSRPPKEKMKEYVLRLLYCEMLGHEVEFGYVHALTLTQSSNILEKKVGYLAVASFLHKEHPLMIMVVNSFRRDLENDNYLIVCSALITMGKLITLETVPTIVEIVVKLLTHSKFQVRKHAVVVLHSCWRVQGTSLDSIMDKVRRALCDKNPSVMIASLNMFDEMIDIHGRERYLDLISSFVSILKQIIENRLPSGYLYHQIPAPWAQIQLLQIIRKLVKKNEALSKHVYEILKQTMKKGNCGINIGFSIIYECVKTAAAIFPHPELLQESANTIAKFISSEKQNLKCAGVIGLSEIVKINPAYAAPHQMILMDCLEDVDETLQQKTLELLFIMTNSKNVITITEKMLQALQSTKDNHVKEQLIARMAENAERHAPNFPWYVETMKRVIQLGKNHVHQNIVNHLCDVLAQGTGEASVKDNQLRLHALKTFYGAAFDDKESSPPLLMQIACWCAGEFAHLSTSFSICDFIVDISSLLEETGLDSHTKEVATAALWKLLSREESLAEDVREVLFEQRHCKSLSGQQMFYESIYLLQQPDLLKLCMLPPGEYDDFHMDSSLSFADDYVKEAIEYGALPYRAAEERDNTPFALVNPLEATETLKWEEYPQPDPESSFAPSIGHNPLQINENYQCRYMDVNIESESSPSLGKLPGTKKSVWSSSGYSGGVVATAPIDRPVYSSFPATSKYSTKFGAVASKAGTKTHNAKDNSAADKKEQAKKTKRQQKREQQAAALLGF